MSQLHKDLPELDVQFMEGQGEHMHKVFLDKEEVFMWDDSMQMDAPEDLCWLREIKEIFEAGARAGLLVGEARVKASQEIKVGTWVRYGKMTSRVLEVQNASKWLCVHPPGLKMVRLLGDTSFVPMTQCEYLCDEPVFDLGEGDA